jgi:acyl dehydratase
VTRYFEDFRAGDVVQLGRKQVTADEIVAFAREYDPQPFHVDDSAAASSPFGGLIASGWHTAPMSMRLFVRRVRDRHRIQIDVDLDVLADQAAQHALHFRDDCVRR